MSALRRAQPRPRVQGYASCDEDGDFAAIALRVRPLFFLHRALVATVFVILRQAPEQEVQPGPART